MQTEQTEAPNQRESNEKQENLHSNRRQYPSPAAETSQFNQWKFDLNQTTGTCTNKQRSKKVLYIDNSQSLHLKFIGVYC